LGYSDFQFKTPSTETYSGITPGTVLASKAVITDANNKVNTLDITTPKIGGTAITSSAAELNLIDNSVAGTAVASKALVLGTNKNVDILAVADLKLGAGAGTSVTSTATELNYLDNDALTAADLTKLAALDTTAVQINSLINFPGTIATSVIDFNTTAEAGMKVTINSVDYQEADVAVVTNGVWTNGASAANSATSLVAAINGDTRATVPFTAFLSADGNSVILTWDDVGTAGNVTITTTSAANCTVENSTGGTASGIKQIVIVNRTVTAQDVLALETNIPLPFVPTKILVNYFDTDGILLGTITDKATIQANPNRVRVLQAGATHLVATNVIQVMAIE